VPLKVDCDENDIHVCTCNICGILRRNVTYNMEQRRPEKKHKKGHQF